LAAGCGGIGLHALDELLKPVDQAGQKREHVFSWRHRLHQDETHQVQRQVMGNPVRLDGLPDPGQVLGQTILGRMPDPAVTAARGRSSLHPQQAALLKSAQRGIERAGTWPISLRRSHGKQLLQLIARTWLADNHTQQYLLEVRERSFSHIYQSMSTLPMGRIDL
jgi:hypothetical protein